MAVLGGKQLCALSFFIAIKLFEAGNIKFVLICHIPSRYVQRDYCACKAAL